jgi:3-oxoacyl-[acyl-carrier protein] reductase
MELGLKGKVALVGASSKGLGKAIAKRLAQEGAAVAICARHEETLLRTADEIQKETHSPVLAVTADLSRKEDIDRLFETVTGNFSKIDILVTNAGGPPPLYFADISDEQWESYLQLSLMSAIRLIRKVLPGMKERRWGRILNLTSVSVKQPVDNLILSNTVRLGIVGLAKTLSNQVAEFNITVNNVSPGYVLTDRVRALFKTQAKREGLSPEEVEEKLAAKLPARRLGRPEELADVFAFLASERASYVTGVTLQVDGGFVKSSL